MVEYFIKIYNIKNIEEISLKKPVIKTKQNTNKIKNEILTKLKEKTYEIIELENSIQMKEFLFEEFLFENRLLFSKLKANKIIEMYKRFIEKAKLESDVTSEFIYLLSNFLE